MQNTTELKDDNIIYSMLTPEQTGNSILETLTKLDKLIDHQKENKQKALVLMDVSKVTMFDDLARKYVTERLSNLPFDKMAIVGAKFVLKQIAVMTVFATGNAKRIEFFDTDIDGLEWLNRAD